MEEMNEVPVEPKVKGKPGRKPKAKAESSSEISALKELVLELVTKMGEQNRESQLGLAAELRKPTDMEQKKLDDERESLRKRALMAVAAAKESDRIVKAKQASCPHKDRNGITCFNGQVSGGRWAVLCNRCQLPAPAIKATHEEQMSGINLRSWENVSYEGLQQLYKQREAAAA